MTTTFCNSTPSNFFHRWTIFCTFSLLLFVGWLSPLLAQQETLARFIITDARLNGLDYTDHYVGSGGYIVFYEVEGDLYLANVLGNKNTQSFGELYSMNVQEIQETDENYYTEIYSFRWSYINDYDSKKGTATVQFTKVFKPVGVAFICKIIPENLDVLEYRGFMEGSIDFSDY